MKHYISTVEVIERGNQLNKLHAAYKNSCQKDKKSKWQEFLAASTEYQKLVHDCIVYNSSGISDLL